jgi:hypothetical protein
VAAYLMLANRLRRTAGNESGAEGPFFLSVTTLEPVEVRVKQTSPSYRAFRQRSTAPGRGYQTNPEQRKNLAIIMRYYPPSDWIIPIRVRVSIDVALGRVAALGVREQLGEMFQQLLGFREG